MATACLNTEIFKKNLLLNNIVFGSYVFFAVKGRYVPTLGICTPGNMGDVDDKF